MKVLDGKVLIQVKRKDACVQKVGGLEIPVNCSEYETADVIAVGPKVEGDIKAGDVVYVYPGAGKEFWYEGERYRVLTSSEIIVVL